MGTRTIRGWIKLPSPQHFRDAVAIVRLNDVALVDAPALRIAETVMDAISGICERIPFLITADEALLTSDSYVLSVEIRCSGKCELQRGDFLTMEAFPWSLGESAERETVLEVKQI